MLEPESLATGDALGIGGLLTSASVLTQAAPSERALLVALVEAACEGTVAVATGGELRLAASERLAFRELGLAIGLSAAPILERAHMGPLHARYARAVAALRHFQDLGATLTRYWLEQEHRSAPSWTDHADINDVMLATALAPNGYLVRSAPQR